MIDPINQLVDPINPKLGLIKKRSPWQVPRKIKLLPLYDCINDRNYGNDSNQGNPSAGSYADR